MNTSQEHFQWERVYVMDPKKGPILISTLLESGGPNTAGEWVQTPRPYTS